ncbi:hypothetical protein ACB098_10G174200 [Castanea mollissima]
MGVITYDSEVTSPIPPARLFKVFVLDADNLIPKISPHTIKSTEILEGNGGPGTIKKHKIDAINKENFTYNYSVIEGGPLLDKIEKISCETKLVATPNGGSIFKSTNKYYAKDDFEIKEEQIKVGKEKVARLFKSVEGYLLANPDAYN